MREAERRRTGGPEETAAVAHELAGRLEPGDVVFLTGEVGTGKTTFVRAACRRLGIQGPVTSPSFTLARRYDEGPVPVSHLDFQRLGGEAGDPGLFAEEVGPDRITFVEWASEMPAGTAWRPTWTVEIDHAGGDARSLAVERGPKAC